MSIWRGALTPSMLPRAPYESPSLGSVRMSAGVSARRRDVFVRLELLQGYMFEGVLVRRCKNDRRRHALQHRFFPAQHAQAPSISWLESGKAHVRSGGHQIITATGREFKKLLSHPGTNDVRPMVMCIRVAATISQVSSEWVIRAWNQLLTQSISTLLHDQTSTVTR